MNIKVVIAAHKKYRMPDDEMYIPLHVGAYGKSDIDFERSSMRDDQGENISQKNFAFCELTGLYWAWKNLDCDYIGLAHYRRHFALKKKKDVWERVLKKSEAEAIFADYDIIVPAKRKYYIETLYSHYAHTHESTHLDKAGEIIAKKCPAYKRYFDRVLKQTGGYMFNMYIMKRELSDNYCSFLFPILFELEKETDSSSLSSFDARYPGRVSEILFNVWLAKKISDEPGLKIRETGYIYMEPVSKVKKGVAFLKAKFAGKKYEQSF